MFTFIVLGVVLLWLKSLLVQLRVHYERKQHRLVKVFSRVVISNLFCCMPIAVCYGFWLSGLA